MARRRKRRKQSQHYPPDVPHFAGPEELARRSHHPMTGFVCASCGWIYIQAGRSGRKACPKCHSVALRRHRGSSLDDLAEVLIPAEVRHEDPIGNEVLVRRRFAEAYERFMRRQDDWASATAVAREIAQGEASRALVAKVYRDLTAMSPQEREGPAKRSSKSRRGASSSELQRGTARPRLEELEHERREAERAKVRGMKKGRVKKRLLKS